ISISVNFLHVLRRKDIDPRLRQPQDAAASQRDNQHEGDDESPHDNDNEIHGPDRSWPVRVRSTSTPVPSISPHTVRRLLDLVDLPPHRTSYRRTSRLAGRFQGRAETVLGCYANAGRLAERGIRVGCLDEIMPNEQVLERYPIRRAIPGSIEQRAFKYTRNVT